MRDIVRFISKRIKFERRERELSQEKLAELADLHPNYLGEVERGEKNITIKNLYKIVVALDITMEDFFKGI